MSHLWVVPAWSFQDPQYDRHITCMKVDLWISVTTHPPKFMLASRFQHKGTLRKQRLDAQRGASEILTSRGNLPSHLQRSLALRWCCQGTLPSRKDMGKKPFKSTPDTEPGHTFCRASGSITPRHEGRRKRSCLSECSWYPAVCRGHDLDQIVVRRRHWLPLTASDSFVLSSQNAASEGFTGAITGQPATAMPNLLSHECRN